MKNPSLFLAVALAVCSPFVFASCSSTDVQDTRMTGVERRQDRMDSRTYARQDRWQERAQREDARAKARFDAW